MREFHYLGVVLTVLGLFGCASQSPAPLESRVSGVSLAKASTTTQMSAPITEAATTALASPAPVETRSTDLQTTTTAPTTPVATTTSAVGAGYYRVKHKETLYRIALEHGRDYRELAKWNNIADPAAISEGMLLRITPPDGSAPVVMPKTTIAATSKGSANSRKTTPNVSKVAYAESKANKSSTPKPAATKTPTTTQSTTSTPEPVAASKSGDGKVVWSWPTSNPLRTGYSAATKGLEFSGKLGDPIRAAADGKVVYAGSGLRGYGELIIIKHSATFLSAYGHNRAILVKEGDSVQRGQKIAEMGNSDSSTIQLHFEVRRQGKPVDPTQYLPARK